MLPSSSDAPAFYRPRRDGIELLVRITPRGGKDAVDGLGSAADGSAHLKIRVRAAPEKGAANAALRKVVAAAAGVPVGAVGLAAGSTSRLKTLIIAGEPAAIVQQLNAAIASAGDDRIPTAFVLPCTAGAV